MTRAERIDSHNVIMTPKGYTGALLKDANDEHQLNNWTGRNAELERNRSQQHQLEEIDSIEIPVTYMVRGYLCMVEEQYRQLSESLSQFSDSYFAFVGK